MGEDCPAPALGGVDGGHAPLLLLLLRHPHRLLHPLCLLCSEVAVLSRAEDFLRVWIYLKSRELYGKDRSNRANLYEKIREVKGTQA